MGKPQLVIMAAGLGSRYGGLKQIAPIDDRGQSIIFYSIFDAARAGFKRVVVVVKPEMAGEFQELFGHKLQSRVELRYAFQRPDMLPPGFSLPEGRTKPWGTAHAVLCAKDQIDGAFCVINADDFYGRAAFEAIYQFLNAPHGPNEHAMVGYKVENTLTENGSVARGVCEVERDYLKGVVERVCVEPRQNGAAYTEDGGKNYTFIPQGTTVSMNFWGFQHGVLSEIEARFPEYLKENLPKNPLKCEYYLPLIPNQLLREGKATVRVLKTPEKWYGVTYPQDMAGVKKAVAQMRERGLYPDTMW